MWRSISLAVALIAVPVVASADPQIGVVDVKAVMDAVPAWNKTVKGLKTTWEKEQSKLKGEQDALKKRKDELDAKRVVSDPAVIAAEEQSLLESAQVMADTYLRQQQLISAQELDLKDQMLKRLEPVVYQIAVDKDLSFVFETGTFQQPNVLFSGSGVDLTKQVITGYKKLYKDKAFTVRQPQAAAPQP